MVGCELAAVGLAVSNLDFGEVEALHGDVYVFGGSLLAFLFLVALHFRHNPVEGPQRPALPLRVDGVDTSEHAFIEGKILALRSIVDEQQVPTLCVFVVDAW